MEHCNRQYGTSVLAKIRYGINPDNIVDLFIKSHFIYTGTLHGSHTALVSFLARNGGKTKAIAVVYAPVQSGIAGTCCAS